MKWKDKIKKLKDDKRITEDYYGLVLSLVEQTIKEEKLKITKELKTLLEQSEENRNFINPKDLDLLNIRLSTIEEIIKLII